MLRATIAHRDHKIRTGDERIADLERKQVEALERRKADQELIDRLNAESIDLAEELSVRRRRAVQTPEGHASGSGRLRAPDDHFEVELAAATARLKFRETELRDLEHIYERSVAQIDVLMLELSSAKDAQRSLVTKVVASEADISRVVAHAARAQRRADCAVLKAADQLAEIAGLRGELNTLTSALVVRGAKLAEFQTLTRRYAARVEELEAIVQLVGDDSEIYLGPATSASAGEEPANEVL